MRRNTDGRPLTSQELVRWQRSRRGRQVLALEEQQLRPALSGLFGRHILQIGSWGHGHRLLAAAEIPHHAVLGQIGAPDIEALIDVEDLPLQSKSVDAVILPHTLEFVQSPHALLREVDRILNDRGRIIILGFNPWSAFGVRSRVGLFRSQLPPRGHFYSVARICDWLNLLGLETGQIVRFGVGFPWTPASTAYAPLRFSYWASLISSNYLLTARKRVIPVNRVEARKRAQVRSLLGAGVTPLTGVRSKEAPQVSGFGSFLDKGSS